MKPKLIVILGQTATGKSDFAVNIAKKFNGEIISADSRQVYKGMNIGTAKITKKEMGGIPHYLLDVANPKNRFSVAEYKKLADKKINEILNRKKIPIICGGTGFYIDAVVNGIIFPEVPPNEKLRKSLYSKSAIALFEYLKKIDPVRAKDIQKKNEKNNKVRLIRAIEIATLLGKVPKLGKKESKFDVLKIGLKIDNKLLKERIVIRLFARISRGMISEIKKLHESGLSWNRMEELGLEYRYVSRFLQNKINRDQMIEELSNAIWQYAKRQNTWFKKPAHNADGITTAGGDKNTFWFNPLKKSETLKIEKKVEGFLK
ncbi:MAG: tRNA (adenosine(37)-N6)-dimethylallyltransferase MiaA [Candidatus Paceibacterota bacterium]|jgi:tRNA dimethylallyltransferase